MKRTYLYVAPEEYGEVRAAGASWDGVSKRWYVVGDAGLGACARWLDGVDAAEGTDGTDGADAEEEFTLVSEEAYVVVGSVVCGECGEETEVICLYCDSALDVESGQEFEAVTVSNVWAVDKRLGDWLGRRELLMRLEGGGGGVGDGGGGGGGGGGVGAGSGIGSGDGDAAGFVNHCGHCGVLLDEQGLHAEPGDVFFGLRRGVSVGVEFVRVEGRVGMSGDYGFEV